MSHFGSNHFGSNHFASNSLSGAGTGSGSNHFGSWHFNSYHFASNHLAGGFGTAPPEPPISVFRRRMGRIRLWSLSKIRWRSGDLDRLRKFDPAARDFEP